MSKVDDELTRRLHGAERPVEREGVFEGLRHRRARRATVRRVQAAFLAVTVVGATVGGFVALTRVFGGDGRQLGDSPAPGILPRNGEIVFAAGSTDGYVHLFAMQPDGSERRQITDFGTSDMAPSVSPDGRTIAFVHQLEDASPAIATLPIGGGVVTWLTDADLFVTDGPTWSPDGTLIAFAAHDGDGQEIFVMNSNGSDPHAITGDEVHWAEGPSWSPDGSKIAFAASPVSGDEDPSVWDIYTIGSDGASLLNVTDTPDAASDESSPTWSPDGRRIAFSRASTEQQTIIVRTLLDGSERPVTDGTSIDASPAWSPDGRWIAFDRSGFGRESGEHPGRAEVWRIRPDGSEAAQLTTERGFGPSWQPLPTDPTSPGKSVTPEPSPSPAPSATPEPGVAEIGLDFRLCHASRLGGIDWLGDGARGIAWVGTKASSNGTCPNDNGGRYGVAADFNGDGIADSWSGETIASCLMCEPFKAVDLNADGGEDLIVTLSHFSIMQYGIYTVTQVDSESEVVPFVTGEPGHPQHGLHIGRPFTFWVGGDAGISDYFYCDRLPEFWLTGTESPIDGGAGDVTKWHETQVSLTTAATAKIPYARTYTVPYGTVIDHQHTTSKPDCGLGVDVLRSAP